MLTMHSAQTSVASVSNVSKYYLPKNTEVVALLGWDGLTAYQHICLYGLAKRTGA
jgi:hypothetical protein